MHIFAVFLLVHIHMKFCYSSCTNLTLLQDGRTALYSAAEQGHEDAVELLLEAKADPEVKEKMVVDM